MTKAGLYISFFFLCATAWTGPMPFDPGRGLVEVEVTIDGRAKGIFGIDTGADRLYIDQEFLADNNLTVEPLSGKKLVVAGIDGSSETSAVTLRSLCVGGDETLYNLTATAIDMNALTNNSDLPRPDGLIGHDVLRRFYVTVDYPGQMMELASAWPDFLRGEEYYEIPFTQHRHLILVDATINDEITVPMILDYCASLSTISPSLAEQLGLSSKPGSRVTMSQVSIDGAVTSLNVQAKVTDHSNLRKSVPKAEFGGILGASFLYRYKITVDYKSQRIYVHW